MNLFLSRTYKYMLQYYEGHVLKYEKRNTNLEWWSFAHGGESPSLLVPCLKSTANYVPPPLRPNPRAQIPANMTFIYIQMT